MNDNLKIIICPNDEKNNILNSFNNDSKLHNIKFMTKNEFIKNYFFDYDYEAIYYLMKKYKYNLDVCKVYLKNMYVIDIDKTYNNEKLKFLKDLKIELIENKLIKFNVFFKNYIKNKNIEIINYFDLDLYEEKAFNYKVDIPSSSFSHDVYEFKGIEDEVNFVALKIIELIKKGISLDHIYLSNVTSDYYYILDKVFSYYKIPININFNDSIYNTVTVNEFLNNYEIDLEDSNKNNINRKLINIVSKLSFIDNNDPLYRTLLIDSLKSTYFSSRKLSNAVNIKDLYSCSFSEDDYVFVLGFNQDSLPKMYKDIEYIDDSCKSEVDMYSVSYLNKRSKDVVTYLLSRIKNLYLSYKLSTPFQSFYKSSLINDLGLNVINYDEDTYEYSNIYNKLRLAEYLDKYYLYGEKDKYLELLNTHYDISYNSYNNKFTGINKNNYINNIKKPLKLSYTSINSYNECAFKYYISYVLKLDIYEDTFSAFIGSMYHKILSLYKMDNFSFDSEFDKFLSTRDLSIKEKVLLVKIRKDLNLLLDKIKEQNLLTGYNNELYEKECRIKLDKDIDTEFVGYIDKIMYLYKNNNNYFSIVDYKTGTIDTHIEPMKYGLHLQLPVYLYLIYSSNIFSNPIFTGIYYQNILFNYPTWSEKIKSEVKEKYKLKGYSTDNTEVLEVFDTTYEASELIKSMKYDVEKGFSRFSKLISDSELKDIVDYTKNIISSSSDKILNGEFDINPKVYDRDNVSCKFCKYKDLCFMKEKDLVYLEKVDNLDFLGGEE